MPYLKNASDIDELELPSSVAAREEHEENPDGTPAPTKYVVSMKRKASYGDSLAAQNAMIRFSQGQNGHSGEILSDMELARYLRTLAIRLIVSWNLDDEDGQVLPVTEQTLEMLEPRDGQFLTLEAQQRLGRRPELQQRDFSKPSSASSMGTGSRTKRR
jgi:hypothetical protein